MMGRYPNDFINTLKPNASLATNTNITNNPKKYINRVEVFCRKKQIFNFSVLSAESRT